MDNNAGSALSKQFISSIPITRMSRLQWIQFQDAIKKLHKLEAENRRLKAPETEDEWDRHAVSGCNLVRGIDRISFRAIIAARAQVG